MTHPVFSVDEKFQPNYLINQQRDRILDIFVEIEAQSKVWEDIEENTFLELEQLFDDVFPYLPQQKSYKIVYQQCILLTESLGDSFEYSKFTNFLDNCQSDLNKIIKEINSKHTVKVNVSANPATWPAPLTVTLDARSSVDPSWETIPSNNFFWYYKDTDWVDRIIWQWAVVNYTFEKEGNYFVHVTVRSVNNQEEWILDGDETFNVNVSPQAAILTVYMNGQKMDDTRHIKLWSKEAKLWVSFDGSATSPQGWRQIMEHRRQIKNSNWFTYKTKKNNGWPGTISVPLPDNGEYTVTLSTVDNQNNEMVKNFLLKVSDPIAAIRQTPEEWDTTWEFRFDASKSYSIQSRIRLYTREIYDWAWEKIYTVQSEELRRKFDKPWPYNIKLIVADETWEVDEETITINIKSAPPLAQFSYKPIAEREQPSQFIFDASRTTDIDVSNGYDALTYKRTFSDNEFVTIDKEYENNKLIVASFNKVGTYQVTLTATDSFGQSNSKTIDLKVDSSLRPVVLASPKATIRWEPVSFAVRSNDKDIVNIQRDFW